MKTTKVVEITICDVCGNEKRHQDWPCSRCNKDICDTCEEHFRIEMTHNSKYSVPDAKSWGGVSQKYITLTATQRICKECAVEIVKGLDSLGLVGVPERDLDKFMAVMD